MNFKQAISNLVRGRKLTESVNVVDAEVSRLCKTPTDGLHDWLGSGDYDKPRSASDLAREWDELSNQR